VILALPCSVLTHRVPLDDFPALYASFDKRVGGEGICGDEVFGPPLGRCTKAESRG
jgi:hypothetical protein